MTPRLLLAALLLTLPPLHAQTAPQPEVSTAHPEWTTSRDPFRIAGNLYYVGSRDLAAYLITTPQGNILINENLDSSPPQIRAAIERLGFRWADTRILLNSQAHFDHTAGAAEIIRETHAQLMVMQGDAALAEDGGRTDFAQLPAYPPAHVTRILHDGDLVSLGGTTLVAHKTAGHTRGCTTFTLQVQDPRIDRGRPLNVVIVGGLSALDNYRLVATPAQPASYPGIAADFVDTFRTLRALPCDIFLGAHGQYFDMEAKLARLPLQGPSVWIDPAGYQRAIGEAEADFREKLEGQRQAAAQH